MRGAPAGAALHLEGLRLLRRERGLWPLAAVPFALSVLAVGAALAALWSWAAPLHAAVTGWLPWPEAASAMACERPMKPVPMSPMRAALMGSPREARPAGR